MSLSRNILANYGSQIYVTAIGIVMVPQYIKYMGPEAYGLVGFFAMLLAWFNLLDMGLTPTMARESARFRGGAITALDYRRLARALEGVFIVVALVGGALLFGCANWLARRWLNANELNEHDVIVALRLMAIIVALRWMCGLYRGVIAGAEQLVWLSGFNSVIATGRFVLILPVLMFVSTSPSAFFGFQLGMALFELTGLALMAYRLLPAIPPGQRIRWEWAPLKPVLKFSLTIAFTSSAWVLVTQTDKLVLSSILSLGDYGYFTIAVLAASGIMMISGPVSSALMPRMARLQAEGQEARLIELYRQSTQLVTVLAIPPALMLIFFAPQILWVWTGDAAMMSDVAPAMALYSAGYAFLVVGAFPYYLQYAKGELKLHLIGSALFVLMLVPAVIWAAYFKGMTGAGWAWVIANAMYFFLWTPLVHRRFSPGLHASWLMTDIARPALVAVMAAALAAQWLPLSGQRLLLSVELVLTGFLLLALTYSLANRIKLLK